LWRIWGSIRRKSRVERQPTVIRASVVSFLDVQWEVQWFAVSFRPEICLEEGQVALATVFEWFAAF
jgi:hypothetical protein